MRILRKWDENLQFWRTILKFNWWFPVLSGGVMKLFKILICQMRISTSKFVQMWMLLYWPVKHNNSSAVPEMNDRGHIRHGPRGGCCAPFAGGELVARLTQCGLGWGLLLYSVASSSIQPFGHNRHGPKIGGSAHFWERKVGSPSNTMSLGWRSTSLPSAILIHPAIWPQ